MSNKTVKLINVDLVLVQLQKFLFVAPVTAPFAAWASLWSAAVATAGVRTATHPATMSETFAEVRKAPSFEVQGRTFFKNVRAVQFFLISALKVK